MIVCRTWGKAQSAYTSYAIHLPDDCTQSNDKHKSALFCQQMTMKWFFGISLTGFSGYLGGFAPADKLTISNEASLTFSANVFVMFSNKCGLYAVWSFDRDFGDFHLGFLMLNNFFASCAARFFAAACLALFAVISACIFR